MVPSRAMVELPRTSPLRWLVAGTFSANPEGRVIAASGQRFTAVMAALRPRARVEVANRLGSAPRRTFDVSFNRPRDFRTPDVAAALEPLRRLLEVADDLVRARNPIEPATARARVHRIVGDGPLVQALDGGPSANTGAAAAPSPTEPPAAANAEPPPSGGSPVDPNVRQGQSPPRLGAGRGEDRGQVGPRRIRRSVALQPPALRRRSPPAPAEPTPLTRSAPRWSAPCSTS